MSRYGYDYGFQDDRHRAMKRGYDGDHRFVANDMGTWSSRPYNDQQDNFQQGNFQQGGYQNGGFQGRPNQQFGRGYDRGMAFHPSDAIPRRMGHSYGAGYDRQQGFFGGYRQPHQGYSNRGYDRSGGYDFNGGYGSRNQQVENWQDIYRQLERPRAGGMTSAWQSNIPGVGMRPGFPYGMGSRGPWI